MNEEASADDSKVEGEKQSSEGKEGHGGGTGDRMVDCRN